MSNIINGTTAQVIADTNQTMIIDELGREISTGAQILDGTPTQIKNNANLILIVDESGNSIS